MISLEKMLINGLSESKVIGMLEAFYIYYIITLQKEN